LVGSFVSRKFLDEGYDVAILSRTTSDFSYIEDIKERITIYEGDILDILSLENAMNNIDTVIHCAALVSLTSKEKKQMFKINIEGTKNVVDVCLKYGIKELVHISSVAALGRNEGVQIVDESSKWTKSELNSAYAESKYLAEIEVWRGIAEGLNAFMVNPSVVLGQGSWEKSSGQIFKYIHDGKPFYTNGKVNYIDVRDVAESVWLLLKNQSFGERYILNAGSSTYKELFRMIAEELGKKPPSILISNSLLWVAFFFEKIKSLITGKPSLITRETILMSEMDFFFDNKKVKERTGIRFRPLEETIEWSCKKF